MADEMKKCANCMVLRRGDCFGQEKICDKFRQVPEFFREERESWPEFGDATAIRLGVKRY